MKNETERRPHAHLCDDCKQVWRCVCVLGWKVAYVSCGCGK